MSESVVTIEPKTVPESNDATWKSFLELTKPRISVMVLFSIIASAVVAAGGSPGLWPVIHVAVGMFLIAASGNAANMYRERYTDFLMPRTARRPLPGQKLGARQVASFAAVTLGIGIGYFLVTVNPPVWILALSTWVLYVFVYTPLKTVTPWNTEIGAIPGAMPVLVGAMAVDKPLSLASWGFFLVLLFWQFPHFMAIAWLYKDDYKAGGLKMITVADPTGRSAGRKAIALAIATGAASLVPLATFGTGWEKIAFSIVSLFLAGWYLRDSIRFARSPGVATARKLLRTSVIYLPLYMCGLILLACFGGR